MYGAIIELADQVENGVVETRHHLVARAHRPGAFADVVVFKDALFQRHPVLGTFADKALFESV